MSKKYLVKEIVDIRGFDIAEGYLKFMISDIQSAELTNASEVVWATGRNGTRLGKFETNKTATLSGSNGSIDTGLMALQTGSDINTVADYIGAEYTDIITVGSGGASAVTKFKATGTAGSEIKFIYARNDDGSTGQKYAQADLATAESFNYDPTTKEITLPTGAFSAGNQIVAFYKPKLAAADIITNKSDKFAGDVKLVADTLFRDQSTSKDYFGQIVFEKAAADGNFNLTFGGDPSVQEFSFEAMLGCGDSELWSIIVFDEEDFT